MRRKPIVLTALVWGLLSAGVCPPTHAQTAGASSDRLEGTALVAALRQGGYVLAIRHTATDASAADVDLKNLEDCSGQRNLNDTGRRQAIAIGQAVAALGIPIGEVFASPFCRTRETAELAFGRFKVDHALYNAYVAPDERPRLYGELRRRLALPPAPGTNTVLVTHGFNVQGASGESPAEGETVVFRPDDGKGFGLVGRLTVGEWTRLSPQP